MAHQLTHGGTVYGPGYEGRLLTPDEVRNAPLRKRGWLRRWYAVKDVRVLLGSLAVDVENRMRYVAGLEHTIRQLRNLNESLNAGLRQWQTKQAQEAWAVRSNQAEPY